MKSTYTIPPMVDDRGKHWRQPARENIKIDHEHARMSAHDFELLADYSHSIPSGVYAGKMWRCLVADVWWLCWLTDRETGICDLNRRRIQIVGAGLPGVEGQFSTLLVDPPWRFQNSSGKVAPEHKRLARYRTMSLGEICSLPVAQHAAPNSHLYLWCPNALLPDGLQVMHAWGFRYITNLVWSKVRKDGGPDGRGVGFYFRNTTELLLFGLRGKMRTLAPARRQVNLIASRKREHSRKPDEAYTLIEACSPGPYLELFARGPGRPGWTLWGDEAGKESA